MKRFLSILSVAIVVLLTSLPSIARVNYRGFVDVAAGFPYNSYISTTHGIQLSAHVFTGIGAELNFIQDGETALSPKVDVRYDFRPFSKNSSFMQLEIGARRAISVDLWAPFVQLAGGYRRAFNDHFGLNVGPFITLGEKRYSLYGNSAGIRVGIDF